MKVQSAVLGETAVETAPSTGGPHRTRSSVRLQFTKRRQLASFTTGAGLMHTLHPPPPPPPYWLVSMTTRPHVQSQTGSLLDCPRQASLETHTLPSSVYKNPQCSEVYSVLARHRRPLVETLRTAVETTTYYHNGIDTITVPGDTSNTTHSTTIRYHEEDPAGTSTQFYVVILQF